MPKLLLVLFFFLIGPVKADRCEGSAWCDVCTDCSKCGYCSFEGNSCGVCDGSNNLRPRVEPVQDSPAFKYSKEDQHSVLADVDGDGKFEKFVSVYWGGEYVTLSLLDDDGSLLAGSLTDREGATRVGLSVDNDESHVADIDGDGRDQLVQPRLGRGPNPWLDIFSWDDHTLKLDIARFSFSKNSLIFLKDSDYRPNQPDKKMNGFNYYAEEVSNHKDGELLVWVAPYENANKVFGWTRKARVKVLSGNLKFLGWQAPWTHQEIGGKAYATGFLLPKVHFDVITEDDLKGLSAKQLTLLRNEVFAIEGRSFNDPEIRAYFQSQPWYKAQAYYSESLVQEHAKRNATFVGDYQKKNNLVW